MRKLLLLVLVMLFGGAYATAQKFEVSGGYNYLHVARGGSSTDNGIPGGFYIDGTYYFAKEAIGLTGDFEYNKKTFGAGELAAVSVAARDWSFHVGPRVKARVGKAEPFAHILFGVTDLNGTPAGATSVADQAFSMKLGGGLDIAIAHRFAFRLGEFNYYMTRFRTASPVNLNGNNQQNNFTISTGIVIRLK